VAVEAHGHRILLPAARSRVETGAAIVGVRPEKMHLAAAGAEIPPGRNVFAGGVVTDASFIGVSTQYLVKMPWGEELAVFEQNSGQEIHRPGSAVSLHWEPGQTFGLDGAQDIEAGAGIDDEAAS
jgi:spermidine/putrescine transport system ATP-binding protein